MGAVPAAKPYESIAVDERSGDIYLSGREDNRLAFYHAKTGISYNLRREEIYIPYDNHATLHVVVFHRGGEVSEIKLLTYGNDATAPNLRDEIFFVATWAQGEIDVVELNRREPVKRFLHKGILPQQPAEDKKRRPRRRGCPKSIQGCI